MPGEIRHASCAAWQGRAVLIEGPSGAGKSSLTLQLLAYGADLVADDRTRLVREGPRIIADAPPTLPHAIEARGIGLLPVRLAGPAEVVLVVDLSRTETARLPEPRRTRILGQDIALLHKCEGAHFSAALIQYLKGTGGPLHDRR